MIESRWAAILRMKKADYAAALMRWRYREPPKWKLFKYYLWTKAKPKRTW